MKFDKHSSLLAVICVLLSVVCWLWCMSESASADWNEEGTYTVQDEMWSYLMERFNNPIAAAAIMGNAGVESNFCPWRYCGDNNPGDDYSASKYYVDSLDENEFVYQWYCYPNAFGLFQFHANYHMQNLWNLSQEQGVPVYDVTLQTEYMMGNIEAKLPEVYEYFFTCDDLIDATEVFRSFGVGSTFTEKSVNHRINRAIAVFETFTGEEYDGKIYFPMWNGGTLHTLKK